MNNPPIPNAKFDNLVVQEFSNEVLIYNLTTNKAYSLNATSTLVWRLCDGTKDAARIAAEATLKLNQTVPEDMVWLALDSLKKEDLVTFDGDERTVFNGFKRREVIKRVGLASLVALPLISSLIAPSSAQAQSGFVCGGCITGIGVNQEYICPDKTGCPPLICTCYGNNSCNGNGQNSFVTTSDCSVCENVGNSDKNNSYQCVPAIA